MKKYGAILLTLVAVIVLIFIFADTGDYGQSTANITDADIPLATTHATSLFSYFGNRSLLSDSIPINEQMNRTLVILAILFALWILCILLATRHNLFLNQKDKHINKTKGRQAKK